MKKLRYFTLTLFFAVLISSCNEGEWLKEVPKDFYSADNAYTNQEQFNSAVARLYEGTNNCMKWSNHAGYAIYIYASDVAHCAISPTTELSSYIDNVRPENSRITGIWQAFYKVIYDANVVINRIDDENATFSSEAERNILKAEATFFRAFMYRNLGILFGGVPIVLEEISSAKRDFVRASREKVWAQCIEDLEYAASNLPEVTDLKEDGRLTKAAANHLLSELYIITGDYDKAITASSSIINDPNYALMQNRFGTRKDEPGDVYWDLFRRDNQNRVSSGNTESIWVCQYEYLSEGGGGSKWLWINPTYYLLKDTDGENLFIGPMAQYGGRSGGWMAASDYMLYDVWEDAGDDIRCSETNIIRDIVANNEASAYYGEKIVESGAIASFNNLYNRFWTAIWVKECAINNFPDAAYDNKETGLVNRGAGETLTDLYYMRLAETYLLRAEAYLHKGDKINAAADINVVRARANANPVDPGNVDIDYILDERARELFLEVPRAFTLMRLGKLVERVRKYNPMTNGQFASNGIGDHQGLWPIPQSEIERNTEAVLEQNPGYN